jgi:hypothetical protein
MSGLRHLEKLQSVQNHALRNSECVTTVYLLEIDDDAE